MPEPLVEIVNLTKHFPITNATGMPFAGERPVVHAVENVNLKIFKGDFLGLVGESGSGKTTLSSCMVGLLDPTAGSILLNGQEMVRAEPQGAGRARVYWSIQRREIANKIQMIFQDPTSALNPRMTIKSMLTEPLRVHRWGSSQEIEGRVRELFELVGLPFNYSSCYPHELNNAQRQRVVIARALALNPILLLADEPISHLDVSGQAQIMNLLLDLQKDLSVTVVFVAHDMSAVRQIASRVAVMYLGQLMEVAEADTFFNDPSHPYTQALVASVPRFRVGNADEIPIIQGEIPSPINFPKGCPFLSRCVEGEVELCGQKPPPLADLGDNHLVACYKRCPQGELTAVARITSLA